MRKINSIILHCTESRLIWGAQKSFDLLNRDLKFHYYIHTDGSILISSLHREVGYHAKGFNKSSIGICLNGSLKEDFTIDQFASLEKLCLNLMDSYNLIPEDIYGHSELNNNKCPAFSVEAFKSLLISKY